MRKIFLAVIVLALIAAPYSCGNQRRSKVSDKEQGDSIIEAET